MKFEIFAKGDERAELTIYGNIGEDWMAEESNDAKTVVGAIGELSGDVDVRINSYGGAVADGLAIFNALKRHDGHVSVHIDGVAYSIASLIAMAGDDITMASNALMMVHAPWGGAVGNATEMREMADILDKYAEAMVSSYLRPDGPDEATVRGWLTDGEDHYFTATEALEIGLANSSGAPSEIDIAASVRGTKYKHFQTAAGVRVTQENAAMADDNLATPDVAENDDVTAQHSRTVEAAISQGAKAEASRRKVIDQVFAGFYDGDPLNAVTAVYDACMGDIKCDELEARRKLQACLANRSANPVLSSVQYGVESTYSAPPNASRHLGGDVTLTRAAEDKRADGITKALEIRAGLIKDREEIDRERHNEWMGASLTDIMAKEMRGAGYVVAGTRESIARDYVRAMPVLAAGPSHSTGHLTGILADVANKAAMQGWEGSEETWSLWTQSGTLNDYREAKRANLALLDKLDLMRESQEWEYGDLADVSQGIQGYFHGKKYGFSIQSIVNDDLGEITRAMNGWGEAASATVGDTVMALLTTSGTGGYGQSMDEDSTVCFHANHSNYVASGAGGAPAEATLNAGYVAMSKQTDPNSRTIGMRPRFILHGATLASTVYRQLNSELMISGNTTAAPDANWVRSLGLTPVQDYRLDAVFSGGGWYLAAGRRTVEVSGVAGPLVPRVERSMTSNIPGIEYEMSLPFGAAVLDYRGLYFNYGA